MQRRDDGIIILKENEISGFEGIIVDTRCLKDKINVFKGKYLNDMDKYVIDTLLTITIDQELKSSKEAIELVKKVIEEERPSEFELGIPEIAVIAES